MDPNARLAMLRQLVHEVLMGERRSEEAGPLLVALARDFDDLDRWITAGGFLPYSWARMHRDTIKPLKGL